jgi:hypothetical protein
MFEAVSQIKEKKKGKKDPEGIQRFGNKNPGQQSPDLSFEDQLGIKLKDRSVTRSQQVKDKDKGIEQGHVADESGNGDSFRKFAECIRKGGEH